MTLYVLWPVLGGHKFTSSSDVIINKSLIRCISTPHIANSEDTCVL